MQFSFKPRAGRRVLIAVGVGAAALGATPLAAWLVARQDAPAAVRVPIAPVPAAHVSPAHDHDRLAAVYEAPATARPAAVLAASKDAHLANDLNCLAQAVYFEARGETAAGQLAVAQVVLNRVRHPAFPKTVCGVVYQGASGRGCQFSFACDGAAERRREASAWRRARQVAARAMAGAVLPELAGATHFHAVAVAPGWGSGLSRVSQVGLHVFYRFTPRGGRAAPAPSKTAPAEEVTLTSLAQPAEARPLVVEPALVPPPAPETTPAAAEAAKPASAAAPATPAPTAS